MYKCLFAAGKLSGRFPPDLKSYFRDRNVELVDDPEIKFLSEEDLASTLAEYDAVLAGGEPYNSTTLMYESKLKIIARIGVGYDKVDLEEATRRGIFVTWTPIPEIAYAEAEHTFALILSFTKKIPYMNNEVREGTWEPEKWGAMMKDLFPLTLGIVGVGRIGSEVAKRAKAFQMKILYYDVVRREDLEHDLGLEFVELDELLSESDIVSIHAPLNANTRNLFDQRRISKMKKGAILVNTARGPLVNSEALSEALKSGHLGGAGLDVLDEEPPTAGHVFYKLQDRLPNLILTQHVGYGPATGRALAYCAAGDVLRALHGEVPIYLLNTQVLNSPRP